MTDRLSVLVCRGCCCGTSKHPDVDHDAQIDSLRAHLPDAPEARAYVVDCLGPCERSNVVVVRRHGVRRWFGNVLDVDVTRALAEWVRAGAGAPPPELVARREFDPNAPDGGRNVAPGRRPRSTSPGGGPSADSVWAGCVVGCLPASTRPSRDVRLATTTAARAQDAFLRPSASGREAAA